MNYVCFHRTLDAATWGAELAAGALRRAYLHRRAEGEFEDDPATSMDKRFPWNPTVSFRTRELLARGRRAHRTGSVTPRRNPVHA